MAVRKETKKELVAVGEEKKHRMPSGAWLNTVYSKTLVSKEELDAIYDVIKYHGFNRDEILAQLEEKVNDPKLAIEVILVCSLRGPRQAERIKLRNGKTLKQMGIPASDQKGTDNISCSRISASTADLAAYYFKQLNVPKRIADMDLPAWLQFPTAGSIKMPDELRTKHIEFSKRFSTLIGGVFNEGIYSTMMINAYVDDKLDLF